MTAPMPSSSSCHPSLVLDADGFQRDQARSLGAGREGEGWGFGAPLDAVARRSHAARDSQPEGGLAGRECEAPPVPAAPLRLYAFSAAILSPSSHKALLSLIS